MSGTIVSVCPANVILDVMAVHARAAIIDAVKFSVTIVTTADTWPSLGANHMSHHTLRQLTLDGSIVTGGATAATYCYTNRLL